MKSGVKEERCIYAFRGKNKGKYICPTKVTCKNENYLNAVKGVLNPSFEIQHNTIRNS